MGIRANSINCRKVSVFQTAGVNSEQCFLLRAAVNF